MNRSHEPDSNSSSLARPVSIHLHGLNENANPTTQSSMYKQVTTIDASFSIIIDHRFSGLHLLRQKQRQQSLNLNRIFSSMIC